MGIEKFFNSLVNNDTIQKGNLLILEKKIEADFIFIDFNSILYKIALQIENDLNMLLYELLLGKKNLTEKSIEIAKMWNYNTEEYTLENYKNIFSDQCIDEKFIDLVSEDLLFIMGDLINGNNIKKIFISMDGVPNMAKIVEQKKRRYMGYILNESKKEIYAKHKKNLDLTRQTYEENKIRFSRNKILGFHEFMLKISRSLKDEKFYNKLKNKFPYLEKYVFSGSDVPGEGEKKIMEDILENNTVGKYAIYSPDADLIILSSIMINKLNNGSEMYIIRFDQQDLKYDIVDIEVLNQNIYNYVNVDTDKNKHSKNVLDDIMFIFTMFGNDFVHKIESIDAKKDFEILLDAYRIFLHKKMGYIINGNQISIDNLKIYINILSEDEKDLLNDVYLIKHYKNYNHLKQQFKKVFWFKTLHRTLINYCNLSNIIFKYLRKWENDFNSNSKFSFRNTKRNRNEINFKNIQKFIDKNCEYLINDLLKLDLNTIKDNNNNISTELKFNGSNYITQFIKIFLTIELNVDLEANDINDDNLYFNFIDIIKNEIYKHNGKKIYSTIIPNIRLDVFNYTTRDKYHSKKIQENLISKKMQLTDYDIEVYAFEYMLDEYKNRLNAMDDYIGKCSLNYINNQYVYIYDVIEKYHDRYYNIYFGNNYIVGDICEKYFEGISWVFDLYFIKNNSKFNYENISPWFYQYHRSPMLIDLNNYFNTKTQTELKKKYYSVAHNLIKREDFINPFEHYLYVTPKNSINLDKKYKYIKDIINENPNIFPDLNNIIESIMNTNNKFPEYNSNIPIDCRRVSYLSKCSLKTVRDIKFEDFIKLMKNYRDENYFKVTMIPFIKYWGEQIGGSKINEFLLLVKKNYKNKYLQTRNIEFKKMYKMTKKILGDF